MAYLSVSQLIVCPVQFYFEKPWKSKSMKVEPPYSEGPLYSTSFDEVVAESQPQHVLWALTHLMSFCNIAQGHAEHALAKTNMTLSLFSIKCCFG